jgi:hypothetical protein
MTLQEDRKHKEFTLDDLLAMTAPNQFVLPAELEGWELFQVMRRQQTATINDDTYVFFYRKQKKLQHWKYQIMKFGFVTDDNDVFWSSLDDEGWEMFTIAHIPSNYPRQEGALYFYRYPLATYIRVKDVPGAAERAKQIGSFIKP